MKIQFNITLTQEEFEEFSSRSLIDTLWTHQSALDYLDEQGNEYILLRNDIKQSNDDIFVDLNLIYELTPQQMTEFLLKYPNVTKTREEYERVTIIND